MAAGGGTSEEKSRLLRELEVDLECPICMEVFGADPRALTCGHIFCKPCLEKLVKEQYRVDAMIERYIICPECRARDVFSYGQTVDDLQRPLSLRKLADFRDRIVTFLDAKPGSKVACDFCEETTSEATHYCYQCLLNLCGDCLGEHNARASFREHTTTGLERESKCRCRKRKPVTVFCHDCQGLFCSVCIIKQHPRHHRTQDVKTAAAERRDVMENLVPGVKFQVEKFHLVKDTVEQVYKKVDVDYAAIEKEIDNHQEKLIEAVKGKMDELKSALKGFQDNEKQRLKVLVEENEDCLSGKLSQIRSIEELLENASDIEILLRCADFQQVIESQPFGNIKKGLRINIPKFTPESDGVLGFNVGVLERDIKTFTIATDEDDESTAVTKETKQTTSSASSPPPTAPLAEVKAPKIPPRNKTQAPMPDPPGRSRKKERKRHLASPLNITPSVSPVPSAPDLTPDPEAVLSPSPMTPTIHIEERQLDSSPVRYPRDRFSGKSRRKLRMPAPGRYSQFRLVSELLNCESGLVRDFKFNQKQHQLYVSTDDNDEPIQVYDFGMQKLGSIGRGVVNDVHQLCIDEVANNVAIIADKGASIKLLNAFGQLKQVTNCSEISRVWDIDLCRDNGSYVVAYQEAGSGHEAASCLNWGVALIDPVSNSVAFKSESTYQFQSIPNVCYLSHLEAIALSDHCCVKLFDLSGRLIGDIGDNDLQNTLIRDTCEGHGGHLLLASEESMDIRSLRFGPKGGDHHVYGLSQGQIIVTADQLLGGKPKLLDMSKDGFLAVQTVGKYRPRRAHSRAPLIARLQIFSGSYLGH